MKKEKKNREEHYNTVVEDGELPDMDMYPFINHLYGIIQDLICSCCRFGGGFFLLLT